MNVLHQGARLVDETPAAVARTPSEVEVFVVHEKSLVEAADVGEHLAAKHCGGAAGAEDFVGLIELAGIALAKAAVAAAAIAVEDKPRAIDQGRVMLEADV